jgi:hypothetical protein
MRTGGGELPSHWPEGRRTTARQVALQEAWRGTPGGADWRAYAGLLCTGRYVGLRGWVQEWERVGAAWLRLMAAQERRWRAALPVWREPMVAVRDAYVVWIGGTGGRA